MNFYNNNNLLRLIAHWSRAIIRFNVVKLKNGTDRDWRVWKTANIVTGVKKTVDNEMMIVKCIIPRLYR